MVDQEHRWNYTLNNHLNGYYKFTRQLSNLLYVCVCVYACLHVCMCVLPLLRRGRDHYDISSVKGKGRDD